MRLAVHNAARRAFTLVELMVVLAIIGIVSAAIVSEMGGTLEEALLRETARKIMDACDSTNARAVSTGRAHVLIFNSSDGKFAARPKAMPRIAGEGQPAGMAHIPGGSGELDKRISVDVREPSEPVEEEDEGAEGEVAAERERRSRAEVITFFADGSCEPREFFLRDRAGGTLALRINPMTSRLRILEAGAL